MTTTDQEAHGAADATRPDLASLPSAADIVWYMRATGWAHGRQGSHGAMWTRGDVEFSVPHEDDRPAWLREVIGRLASAEGRTPEETAAAVAAYRDAGAATKDCGCSPLEPCGTHLRRGAETDAAGSVPGDSGRVLPTRHAQAQDCPEPIHRPGPKRMVSRQVAPSDCLACGQRWPCGGSWQARAEAAEAKLAEVRAVLLEGGQGDATARCRAIAIVDIKGDEHE